MANLRVRVYFKECYTDNTQYYYLNPTWTKRELMENIKNSVSRDFNVEVDNFEIVEAGQMITDGDNALMPSEEAPSIEINNVQLYQIWGRELKVSLYIRRKNPEDSTDYTCVICRSGRGTNHYGCSHNICNTCVNSCINANINRCSICRQNRRRD